MGKVPYQDHILTNRMIRRSFDIDDTEIRLPNEIFKAHVDHLYDKAQYTITATIYEERVGQKNYSYPTTWLDAWKLQVFYPVTQRLVKKYPFLSKLADYLHSKMSQPNMTTVTVDIYAVYPQFVPAVDDSIVYTRTLDRKTVQSFTDYATANMNP